MVSLEKTRSYILSISLFIVAAGVLAWFYISGEGGSAIRDTHSGNLRVIDFQTLKTEDDDYLMCAPAACLESEVDAKSDIYNVSRSELSQALFSYTDNNVLIRTYRRDLSLWQFDFTERLNSEKFPHVITVQLIAISPEQSSLNIYSRSELGGSNTIVHKERVDRWLRFMESALSR